MAKAAQTLELLAGVMRRRGVLADADLVLAVQVSLRCVAVELGRLAAREGRRRRATSRASGAGGAGGGR